MWWVTMSLMTIVGVSSLTAAASGDRISCEEARLKCAYRVGCGMALQNYVVGCSAVLQGPEPTYCPEICKHSLIALTSTEEGKQLMTCRCSDDFCEDAKRRVEICRPDVITANLNETIVTCRVAQWICAADALCSKAIEYYNRYCKSMFHGKKCTHRCRNSISILRRQEKASKLNTCTCDGREDFDCPSIQSNMARLCFHKKNPEETTESVSDVETNVIKNSDNTDGGSASSVKPTLVLFVVINMLTFAIT